MKIEFLLKTDSGYPTDADFTGEHQRRRFSSTLPRATGSQPKSGYLFKKKFPDLWRRSSSKTRHATELEKIELRISAEITRS